MTEKTELTARELELAEQGEALLTAESGQERTPEAVALEIRTLQRQAQGVILGYAIEIGRRLEEAKAMLRHGEWGDWLKRELDYSQSTAQNFMRVYREYGADQQSFFGGVAKSQAFGNLTISKALRLLAIPEEDRVEFVERNNVASMSTRELDRALKERDEARRERDYAEHRRDELAKKYGEKLRLAEKKADDTRFDLEQASRQAEQAKNRADGLQLKLDNAKKDLDAVTATKNIAAKRADDLSATVSELRREIAELSSRPVEIAVEKVVDEEAVEKARAEAVASMQEKLSKAEKALADAEAARAAAEADKAENEKIIRELNRQISSASPAMTEFKRLYEKWQEDFFDLLEALGEVEKEDPETAGTLRGAITEAVDNMRQQEVEA